MMLDWYALNTQTGLPLKEDYNKRSTTAAFIDAYAQLIQTAKLPESSKPHIKSNQNNDNFITDIDVIVPNKVVVVTFKDGAKEKMVCHKDDTFDLRKCLFVAIAKHLYKATHTWEGVEHEAEQLVYLKKYNRIVDKALKNYSKKLKLIEQEKKTKAEAKRVAANKKRKHEAYLKRREEKKTQRND